MKGPLMLAMGVAPRTAAATASMMIFFTASTVCISYILFGKLVLDYGAV